MVQRLVGRLLERERLASRDTDPERHRERPARLEVLELQDGLPQRGMGRPGDRSLQDHAHSLTGPRHDAL
jgi:hypothetical protein